MTTKQLIALTIDKAVDKAREEHPTTEVTVSAEHGSMLVELTADIHLPDPVEVIGTVHMGQEERLLEWGKPLSIDIIEINISGCYDLADDVTNEFKLCS